MPKEAKKIDPALLKEDVVRLDHLRNFEAAKIETYPARAKRTHTLKEARSAAPGTAVTVVGRMVSHRAMGKLTFCHLKDFSDKLQIAFAEKDLGEERYAFFLQNFDLGDFINVTGEMFVTHKGETSILVREFSLLSKALLPLPDKFHGLADTEIRYRQRYLDLIANEDSMRIAKLRSMLVKEIRNYFDAQGFFEVETPVLQALYGGALAKPFATHHNALDIPLYLRIAPELYLKRLIVGGFEKVYEVAKCFRNEGIDHNHNPEFTQIEFYWAYADYNDLMNLVEDFLPKIITSIGLPLKFSSDGKEVDFTPPYPRVTMRSLIQKYAKIDIEDYPDRASMFALAKKLQVEDTDETADRGKLIDDIYKKYARPYIVNPIFMIDHPVELSPLAKRRADNPAYVERFQLLCVGGNELCNAFSELNDPLDQEARFKEQVENNAQGNEESMPFDEDFVTALKHGMPPTAGLGMGIDRLVKLLVDAQNLKEVILFPTLRPEHKDAAAPTPPGKQSSQTSEKKLSSTELSPLPMNRNEAFQLLKKYNSSPASFNHYLESEAVMRAIAKRLGKDENVWGIAGLLHDIDWDLTKAEPKKHLTLAPQMLRDAGFAEDFVQLILSHGYGCDCAGLINEVRTEEMQFALAAGETVTGLIHAAARLRPDKIASLEVKSVLKKFKDASFAAGVNRSIIQECAKLGFTLEEFLQLAIDAIRDIADKVDLA